MAKCWTCGSYLADPSYTCPTCSNSTELENLRSDIEQNFESSNANIESLQESLSEGFIDLSRSLSDGLSEIASAIKWGFEEISWKLQLQTETLISIDQTLKTPRETQANELRDMGEKLRQRGVLDQSCEHFLKALDLNPLDYRIYIGLARTYIQQNKFDKAENILGNSLPHAPQGDIDYKSYSYRLIGHIHACKEDYATAEKILEMAIKLSPNYTEGHYDYAQYCARTGKEKEFKDSLVKAIVSDTQYFYLARHEENFTPLRSKVENLLSDYISKKTNEAQEMIILAEGVITQAKEAVQKAEIEKNLTWQKSPLSSESHLKKAEILIDGAKEECATSDLNKVLNGENLASRALSEARIADSSAKMEEGELQRKIANAKRSARSEARSAAFVAVLLGAPAGCTVTLVASNDGGIGFIGVPILLAPLTYLIVYNNALDTALSK